jgi:hypothetical protein
MTHYERKIMLRNRIGLLTLALLLITPQASASWMPDLSQSDTVSRMKAEDLLQTRGDGYFIVTVDAITSTPQFSGLTEAPGPREKYAVIVGGVVDRIVTWDGYSPHRIIDSYGVIVKLPAAAGVKYVDASGVTRLKPITQGSIVSVAVAPNVYVTPTYDIVQLASVSAYEEPTSPAVTETYSPAVASQTLNLDESVSMTIDVPDVASLPSTSRVSVYTVTDGRSTTALGLLPGQQTVTIDNLPQDQNVTVKTVIFDTLTNTETVISNTVISTPASSTPLPTPARDAAVDRATIAAPTVVAQAQGTNGHRSASVSVPDVANFDSSKTGATLMIVDKNGSTTAIGLDGVGKVVGVDWLSPTEQYEVMVVLRDLASGQETTISGSRLP